MRFIVFLSSTRIGPSFTGNGSWGDKVGAVIRSRVESTGHEVSMWDPKVLNFPLLQQPIQMIMDKSTIPQWMMDRKKEIEQADGFIACSAEYNCAIPPALANMLDHFPPASFKHRPIGLVTYSMGSGGGLRVQTPLKAMVTDIGMFTVPASVKVDFVNKKFDENGSCIDKNMVEHIDRMVAETTWYAQAIKIHKQTHGLPSISS